MARARTIKQGSVLLEDNKIEPKKTRKRKNDSQEMPQRKRKKHPVKVKLSTGTKSSPKRQRPSVLVQNLLFPDYLQQPRPVSFEVFPGEIFALFGDVRSGKQEIFEIVSRLKTQYTGLVAVDGLDISIYPYQVKNQLGVQLKEGGFLPKLRVREYFVMVARLYGEVASYQVWVERFGFQNNLEAYPSDLSLENQSIFRFILALIGNPNIVLLNEPVQNLSFINRRLVWDVLLERKTKRLTTLLTTDSMLEIKTISDRFAQVQDGSIVGLYETKKVLQLAANSEYEGFFITQPDTNTDAE